MSFTISIDMYLLVRHTTERQQIEREVCSVEGCEIEKIVSPASRNRECSYEETLDREGACMDDDCRRKI